MLEPFLLADESCMWCREPVLLVEDRSAITDGMTGQRRWRHLECAVRSVTGSVAHVNHECSCYVVGADHTDPPGLTRRQAARAAFLAYRRVNGD